MVVLLGRLRVEGRIGHSSVVLLLVLTLFSIPVPTVGQWVHTRLNAPLADGEEITKFAISPDGGYVVYRLEHRYGSETPELYSVPITGGESVRLDQPIEDGAEIAYGVQISPDSRYVVYLEEIDSDGQYPSESSRLYSVPITGGVPVRLDLSSEGAVVKSYDGFQISPDSRYVVYLGIIYGDGYTWSSRLYSVPIAGGAPVQLDPPAASGVVGHYDDLQISADSAHVLYTVYTARIHDPHRYDPYEVYTVPISGGTPIKLVLPNESLSISQVALSADSRYVVVMVSWDRIFELYSFPIQGGSPVRLSNANELSMVSNSGDGAGFLLSGDGKHAIYPLWDDSRKRELMVRVPAGGGERVELAAGTSPAQNLALEGISADGEYVIYTAFDPSGAALYSTPMVQGAPAHLLQRQNPFSDWHLQLSPVGNRVVVWPPHHDYSGGWPLLTIPAQGGVPTVLVDPYPQAHHEQISPDGSQILYIITDHESDDNRTLYSVPMEGGTPIPIGMPITGFEFSVDGRLVVYRTTQSDLYLCSAGFSQYLPYVQGR